MIRTRGWAEKGTVCKRCRCRMKLADGRMISNDGRPVLLRYYRCSRCGWSRKVIVQVERCREP